MSKFLVIRVLSVYSKGRINGFIWCLVLINKCGRPVVNEFSYLLPNSLV